MVQQIHMPSILLIDFLSPHIHACVSCRAEYNVIPSTRPVAGCMKLTETTPDNWHCKHHTVRTGFGGSHCHLQA
jgi:hypothetical protein